MCLALLDSGYLIEMAIIQAKPPSSAPEQKQKLPKQVFGFSVTVYSAACKDNHSDVDHTLLFKHFNITDFPMQIQP